MIMDNIVPSMIFSLSVQALARIEAMKAENDQRKALGQSMAYTYNDFSDIANELAADTKNWYN